MTLKTITTQDATATTATRRARPAALAAGLALALSLAAPLSALAEGTTEIYDNNTGSTLVTVETSDENLAFSVPTIIPFVAEADGELVGPSADATRITNLSVFGIHVTSATVEFEESWVGVSDATMVAYDNAVDFQFGPEGALTDAADATDDDVSASTSYNMTYAGTEGDHLCIATTGDVAQVTNNLVAGEAAELATITWTVSAGNATATEAESAE